MHDPRLGRFFAVDPLTAKYPHYTPYQFSGNKVIQFVELEGLEESGSGSNSGNTAIKNSTTGLMSASLVGEISTTARIGASILEGFEAIATGVEVVATGVATVEVAPAIAVGATIGMGYMMYRTFKDGPPPPIYMPTSGSISCIQVYDERPLLTMTKLHRPTFTFDATSEMVEYPPVDTPDNSDGNGFKYVTYNKVNLLGQVYVGRTSGYGTISQIVAKRDRNHHINTIDFTYGPATATSWLKATVPGGYKYRRNDPAYWAIRGSEQLQIEMYRKLGISGNDRNGISPTNVNLNKYINAAKRLIKFLDKL